MIIRYSLSAVIALIADLLAVVLAFVAALPVFIITDANGRQHLRPIWRWLTTHDASVDEYFMGSYFMRGWILSRFTREQIRNSAFLSYVGRIMWIWRNPAYQVSHWLGYDQRGVTPSPDRFKDERWDSGIPNKSYWRVTNHKGQSAFLYQKQWYYTKHRCVEMQFGWKLYRNDPDKKCMLAIRFSPFKKYGN